MNAVQRKHEWTAKDGLDGVPNETFPKRILDATQSGMVLSETEQRKGF